MLSSFWRGTSLRTKLVTVTTILTFFTVTVTGLLSVIMLRSSLIDRVDAELRDSAASTLSVIYAEHQTGQSASNELLSTYGALVTDKDIIVGSTRDTGTGDAPKLSDHTWEDLHSHGSQGFNVKGTQLGSPGWRVIVYDLKDDSRMALVVARPMADVETTSSRIAFLISTIGMLTTLAATFIAYVIVSKAFEPLRKVERTAAKIAQGDLSQRVAVDHPSTEIGRLSRSLNTMLAHIEQAFTAQAQTEASMRRFVSDASHELRTPLVTIRGYSELYRHGAMQKPEDVASAMGRIESEAKRMTALVEDLLTLARADEKRPLELEPIDLYILALDAVQDAKAMDSDHPVRIVGLEKGQAPRSAPVVADDARMRQVLANLITNAQRYTPAETLIELAVGLLDDGMGEPESVIEVRDHGPGISAEDQARIFERFYRSDESRHRATGGSGLGLAIVAAITAQHGGSVRLSDTEGGGATFRVALPYRPLEDDFEDENAPELDEEDSSSGSSAAPNSSTGR